MTTLIFPALGQLALDYRAHAQNRGEAVVAAASVRDAAMEAAFGELALLPYVYDDGFTGQFLALLDARAISQIYAPVASVHAFLETFLAQHKLPARLVGTSPIRQQVDAYHALRLKAQSAHAFIESCADAPCLSRLEVAAIIRHAGLIYGESNDDKLAAIMAVFASAPKGDVVEIGSLMGKSLSVLQYLARRYQTGAVLSVDPLTPSASLQHDSPTVALGPMDGEWDYEMLREAVIINAMALADKNFNYIRKESAFAFEDYKRLRVRSEHFGEVAYTGKIAVIHIDGNHDFKQVSKDCELWLACLAPGAWVILDDYQWAHGDGPRRVGDALLETRAGDILRAFVCGKALFLQFG